VPLGNAISFPFQERTFRALASWRPCRASLRDTSFWGAREKRHRRGCATPPADRAAGPAGSAKGEPPDADRQAHGDEHLPAADDPAPDPRAGPAAKTPDQAEVESEIRARIPAARWNGCPRGLPYPERARRPASAHSRSCSGFPPLTPTAPSTISLRRTSVDPRPGITGTRIICATALKNAGRSWATWAKEPPSRCQSAAPHAFASAICAESG